MSDDADRADVRIQQASLAGKPRSLIATGACNWCESPVDSARLFCSIECRDDHDHEHERVRRKALGR